MRGKEPAKIKLDGGVSYLVHWPMTAEEIAADMPPQYATFSSLLPISIRLTCPFYALRVLEMHNKVRAMKNSSPFILMDTFLFLVRFARRL